MTLRADSGSSEAMGSSARITSACWVSARAIATRCCWPPESVEARCAARSARPTRSSAAMAWRFCSSLNMPSDPRQRGMRPRKPSRTLSSTLRRLTRLNCWKM